MKRVSILSALLISSMALLITSCSPGRGYYSQTPPPRYGNTFSLIISPFPGFAMSRYPDGRYYYRSPQGYLYWKGYDDRFYLDRSYINRVHYDQREYNEWKRHDKGYNSRRRR